MYQHGGWAVDTEQRGWQPCVQILSQVVVVCRYDGRCEVTVRIWMGRVPSCPAGAGRTCMHAAVTASRTPRADTPIHTRSAPTPACPVRWTDLSTHRLCKPPFLMMLDVRAPAPLVTGAAAILQPAAIYLYCVHAWAGRAE